MNPKHRSYGAALVVALFAGCLALPFAGAVWPTAAAAPAPAPAPAAAAELCACPADIDASGAIGFDDLLAVLSTWGPCPPVCPADVSGDGTVGFDDLLVVLSTWGPCPVFEYGPLRPNAEAEQIGLEMLGAGGPLVLDDATYERVERDLGLIRAFEPALAGEAHSMAWAPTQVILQKNTSVPADEYDALNECLQLVSEDNFAFDFWLLTFPGKLNVPAVVALYEALDYVNFAEPNALIGGQNYWTPTKGVGGTWSWNIDDGFWDCFDGCDCHRLYVFEVTADGTVTLISYQEVGQSWCEF